MRLSHLSSDTLKTYGSPIAQDTNKCADTSTHHIELSHDVGGKYIPYFHASKRTYQDPQEIPQFTQQYKTTAQSWHTASQFEAAMLSLIETHRPFLIPTQESLPENLSASKPYYQISGYRIEQFFNQLQSLIDTSAMVESEKARAYLGLQVAHADMFRGRQFAFDRCDTLTYWPYSHDGVFVHVFEEKLKSLSPKDPSYSIIQAQIDYLLTHNFTPRGYVEDRNIEESLQLVAIDSASRHRVSMSAQSSADSDIAYEVLTCEGAYVYRDHNAFFYEETHLPVPEHKVNLITSTQAEDVVFRRPLEGENLRKDFCFAHFSPGFCEPGKRDTSWWGFCDIKARIQQMMAAMEEAGNVYEYNTETEKTSVFTPAMQREAMVAILNYGSKYNNMDSTHPVSLEVTQYGGYRYNATPEELILRTTHGVYKLPFRLQSVTDGDTKWSKKRLEELFDSHTVDENTLALETNPRIVSTQRNRTGISANHVSFEGKQTEYNQFGYTFDSSGRLVKCSGGFSWNKTDGNNPKIAVATRLVSAASKRIEEYVIDLSNMTLQVIPIQFIRQQDGKFLPVQSQVRTTASIQDVSISRELSKNDDIDGKMTMVENSMRTGDKLCTDSDVSEKLWNGDVYSLRIDTDKRSEDLRRERIRVYMDATFGPGKTGTIYQVRNDSGQVIKRFEAKAVADFFFSTDETVAPMVLVDGQLYYNQGMIDQGILAMGRKTHASLKTLRWLYDLVFLGLSNRGYQERFTLYSKGVSYLCPDQATWQKAIHTLTNSHTSPHPRKRRLAQ